MNNQELERIIRSKRLHLSNRHVANTNAPSRADTLAANLYQNYLPHLGFFDRLCADLNNDEPILSRPDLLTNTTSVLSGMRERGFCKDDIDVIEHSWRVYSAAQRLQDGGGRRERKERRKIAEDTLSAALSLEKRVKYFQHVFAVMDQKGYSVQDILNNIRDNTKTIVTRACAQYKYWATTSATSTRSTNLAVSALDNFATENPQPTPIELALLQLGKTNSIWESQQIYDQAAIPLRREIRDLTYSAVSL